ncbi:MAG: 50S ribosomal protein L23 [bacterium]
MAKTTDTKKEPVVAVAPSVLGKVIITEKAARTSKENTYTFFVDTDATKSEIGKAFFVKFKQKPIDVRTITSKPKSFFRKGRLGFGKKTKKAYITIAKGASIDLA